MTVLWLNFDLQMFFFFFFFTGFLPCFRRNVFHEHVFLRFFGFFGPFYDFGFLPRPFLSNKNFFVWSKIALYL